MYQRFQVEKNGMLFFCFTDVLNYFLPLNKLPLNKPIANPITNPIFTFFKKYPTINPITIKNPMLMALLCSMLIYFLVTQLN